MKGAILFGEVDRGFLQLEHMLLTVDSFLLYTVLYERDVQEQPERVLQLPLPCGLVSQISTESARTGD